ncbi:MAG: 2-dehydropantoate 2-reductase [Burkholderiales bacterium]|nr:2-dehydropantoate 2-reductase [Burkholderiales bacterium]
MNVCIYGAGAVGGFIGARLAHAGHPVAAVARGATLAALRRHGLRLAQGGQTIVAPVRAEEDPARIGPQALVVIAVKAPSLAEIAPRVAPLLAPDTVVLVAMNGVPWWFFDGLPGPHAGTRLASVDPDGAIAAAIPTRHVVGCVVHASCSTPEPGLVRHGMGNGLIVGEPAGGRSARVEALAAALARAGFAATVSERIQRDIWYKLWGNMTMNPVSALTGATADRILDDPLVRGFMVRAMEEAAAIGSRIGCAIGETAEARIAVTRKLGAFKTSMLQDVEAGRPIELDALVAAVREIGARAGVPTPTIDALLGLARLFGEVRGLYRAHGPR